MPKSSNASPTSPARLPKDTLKKLNIGQSFAEYDIIRDKAGVVVDTPAMRSALDRDRSKYFFIGRRGTGKTAITFQVAKAAAESVYSGVGVRRGVAKVGWNLGQFRAVLARIADRRECSR